MVGRIDSRSFDSILSSSFIMHSIVIAASYHNILIFRVDRPILKLIALLRSVSYSGIYTIFNYIAFIQIVFRPIALHSNRRSLTHGVARAISAQLTN